MKLTTDIICEKGGKIILIRRAEDSTAYPGKLALPGGFVDEGERVEDTAKRELKEETGVECELKEILGVYSDPKRDPRGHTISTAFIAEWKKGEPKGMDDAKEAGWHELDEINTEEMAFDHGKILQDYLKWKKEKGTYWSLR